MLLKLRDKVTGGKAAVVIVVLLAIPFAFFGIGNYFSPDSDASVARIQLPGPWYSIGPIGRRTQEISEQAYRTRIDQSRERLRRQLGDRYDGTMFDDPEVRRQILDQMIDEELLAHASRREGLAVSDQQVAAEIRSIPAFQVDGQFDFERYQMTLAAQSPRQTPGQFDASIRQELAMQMVPAEVGRSAFATDAEVDAFVRLREQRRSFRYLAIERPELGEIELSDEEVRDWYDRHQEHYRSQETVSLEYVEVSADAITVPITVDEASLRRRYDEQRRRFVTPAQWHASHILLNVPIGAGEEEVEAVRLRAQALAEELEAGAVFADLAREHTDDPGSRLDGGDLGWIEEGTMADAFERALHETAAGTVSPPVRTSDGWHLVAVHEVREGETRSFEDARDELEAEALAGERERAFSDLAGRLMDATYRDPTALAPAAEELGLELGTTGPFSRVGGGGIAAHPDVVRAAFSDRVLVDGEVSAPIEIATNHIVVVRVAEHVPAEPIALEDVRDEVEDAIRDERIAQAASGHAAELLGAARAGEGLDDIAARSGGDVEERVGVRREDGGVDRTILDTVFAMRAPAPDAPDETAFGLAELGPRDFALVELQRVEDGDPSVLDDSERRFLRLQIGQAMGGTEAQAYIQALRRTYPVRIHEQRLR